MEMNEKEEIKAPKKAKAETDPWRERVSIMVPRAANGEENFIIAQLNGRNFKIKRGVQVEVPKPIAEMVQKSFEYQEKEYELIDSLTNK